MASLEHAGVLERADNRSGVLDRRGCESARGKASVEHRPPQRGGRGLKADLLEAGSDRDDAHVFGCGFDARGFETGAGGVDVEWMAEQARMLCPRHPVLSRPTPS